VPYFPDTFGPQKLHDERGLGQLDGGGPQAMNVDATSSRCQHHPQRRCMLWVSFFRGGNEAVSGLDVDVHSMPVKGSVCRHCVDFRATYASVDLSPRQAIST